MLLLLMVDLILIIIGKHQNLFRGLSFRKSWQKCSLDILSIHAKETKNINLKNKISLAYKKYQNGFYVNSENFVNNIENIAKYLGRYLARPAIADYQLLVLIMILLNFGFKHLILIKRIFV